MRIGALLEDPISSMAETVLDGMGVKERAGGERLESSQPAKNPQRGTNKAKARNRFANGLQSIDRSPDETVGGGGRAHHLTPRILMQKLPES